MSREIETGTPQLLGRIDDGVAILTINRPEARNAMNAEWMVRLRRLIPELGADPEVGCLVLTGAGGAFCAGGDVKGMGGRGSGGGPAISVEDRIAHLRRDQAAVSAGIYELAKPVVASIPGPAAGAGLSLALACDLRIMAESAFITTAFRTVGFSGDYGGSWFLTRLVGTAKARELYYLGERIDAKECERLGIANRVVPERYMKENLNRALDEGLRACLDMEADRMIRSGQTEDHREAVQAFIEKRPPTFRGR
jgi:2-(1,2-epoxy-1,2-dihydrophenyl)acetyl-CoA isomerase